MEISCGSQREQERGGKKERRKKREKKERAESRFAKRSNDRPVQQLGDHLRESDLNTGCRLLNSRTVSIHSRPRVCRAEGASRSPASSTDRRQSVHPERSKLIRNTRRWNETQISSRARSARIGGLRTGFSRDE